MAADEHFSKQRFHLPESCETSSWKDCANNLSTLIWDTQTWYDNQPINICKLQCSRKLKGRVSHYQWIWDARFECGEHAPGIIGEARGLKVRQHAMKEAIAESIEQGFIYGKLTPNDFQCD